jgi:AraC-like DNA-binding protein
VKITAAMPLGGSPNMVPLIEAQTHAFIISRLQEPTIHFNWHYHNELELVWIRHGRGLRYVGCSVEPFKNGDLVLLGRHLPHTWGSSPEQRSPADWTVIQFEPGHWGEAFLRMAELRELRELLGRSERGVQFVGGQVERIGKMMENLATLPTYSFESLVLFFDICHLLLSTSSRSLNACLEPARPAQPDPRLQQLLAQFDALHNNYLPQSEVARWVHMAPAAFSRWFKNQMGRTFQRYQNEVRVARICACLADGDKSITSVAMECGFNNMANFNRRFREITGLTPRIFRAQTRELCYGRKRT